MLVKSCKRKMSNIITLERGKSWRTFQSKVNNFRRSTIFGGQSLGHGQFNKVLVQVPSAFQSCCIVPSHST